MTEKHAIDMLRALGCEDISSKTQKKNETTAFKLPTGHVVTEHRTGYIRRTVRNGYEGNQKSCYQLNPVYQVPYKNINYKGELYETTSYNRMLIWNRAERLKRLVLYTIKQINKNK
tara:strand:- start:307 stop:654 length:348 start_codon:yes stop_codon:yes gene_type:complete